MLRCTYALASIAFVLSVFAASATAATAKRTFVASNGNDANPCSLMLPCRAFTAAIAQTVSGGEVIVLDSAGYGPVAITKSASIIAPTGVYAGISVMSGQTGVIVNGAGIVVVLRGLSINGVAAGSVNGIHYVQGARLRVEACVVSNLASTGIKQDAAGSEMIVTDTVVRDNGGAGVSLAANATAVFNGLRAEHNAGDGIHVVATSLIASATVRHSVLAHNGGNGATVGPSVDGSISEIVIEDTDISNNSSNGVFASGIGSSIAFAIVRHDSIANNGLLGVSVSTGPGGSGLYSAFVNDNSFADNRGGQTKSDGVNSTLYASHNVFDGGASTSFATSNSGKIMTYQDNSGVGSSTGTAPIAATGF